MSHLETEEAGISRASPAYSVHFLKICHMESVAVSLLGTTKLIFVEPGVKINGAYYRDVLLGQHLLPAIRSVAGDFFTYNAPAQYELVTPWSLCLAIHQISSHRCRGRPIALT